MRSRSLLALGLVTLLAVLAAAGSVYWRATSHALPPVPAALFPELLEQVNEVARIEVASATESFTVAKGEGEAWLMPAKDGYPVPYERVKQAVLGLATMRPLEAKTARPERHAQVEVVDPRDEQAPAEGKGVLFRLLDAEGQALGALIVGKTRSLQTPDREGWYYVRRPDEAQSWLAEARFDIIDKASGWLDTDIVRVERKRIRAAGNRRAGGEPVSVSRPSPERTDFAVDEVPEGMRMIHPAAANNLASALGFVAFDDVAKAERIDFSDAVTAEFRTFDGLVVTVDVATVAKEHWARFSAAHDPESARREAVPEADREKLMSPEEVREEAERINSRFGAWAYNIPKHKADDLTVPLSKMIAPDKPDAS